MYQVKVNERASVSVATDDQIIDIEGKQVDWNLSELPGGTFSIIADGKSYEAMVENIDRVTKKMDVRVNGNSYSIAIQEPIDTLLAKMGLDISKTQKAAPIKAPMPGLVLKIMVTPGQQLKKGDPVLILEAMKMENVFKAPADATVKAIKVEERKAVEKGEILIELE